MPLIPGQKQPRVILGLMTFGPDVDTGARVTSLDEFKTTLDDFQKRGYSEVDTARAYIGGKQEAFTRDAKWQDRGLTLATKVYPYAPGIHKPAQLREHFETSLKELGSKTVDIFYLHAADRSVPFEETLREVNEFHKEGKFVRLGLSNFTSFEVAEVVMTCKANGWVRPTVYQGMYNAITRSLERELIPACKRYGLDVVVYNPIAGGLFSGKYSADALKNEPTEGRFSSQHARFGQAYRDRYFSEETFGALATVEPVAKAHNLTLLETALRWMVHHSKLNILDGNDGLLIGVSSQKQLDGNLDAIEKGPLPQEVVDALDKAWKVAEPATPNYWHMQLEYSYDTVKELFGTKA